MKKSSLLAEYLEIFSDRFVALVVSREKWALESSVCIYVIALANFRDFHYLLLSFYAPGGLR